MIRTIALLLAFSSSAWADLYDSGEIEWTRFVNGQVGSGFPTAASETQDWNDFSALSSVDAAFRFSVNGRIYVFKGNQYYRYNPVTNVLDAGYPRTVSVDGWLGGPKGWFDAVLEHPSNGYIYFFRGVRYYRFNIANDRFEPGYRTIGVNGWFGANWTGNGVDAAVYRPANGKVYFFKNDEYVRYDLTNDSVDNGYPRKTGEYGWRGLRKQIDAAVSRGVDTIDFLHPAPEGRDLTTVFNMTDYSIGGPAQPDSAIHDVLIHYLDGAVPGTNVILSIPGFDNTEVASAIRGAYDRGVNIKIITQRIVGPNEPYDWKWVTRPVASILFPPVVAGTNHNEQDPFFLNGRREWGGNEPGRQALGLSFSNHAKVFLFESSQGEANVSIISSANLRDRDRIRQNDAIVIRSAPVYKELYSIVSRMWLLAQNGTQAEQRDWSRFGRTFEIDRDLEVYVVPSPHNQAAPRDPHLDLLDDVNPQGTCRIKVAGSSWDNNTSRGGPVVDKLVALKAAGCDVRVSGHDASSGAQGWHGQETKDNVFAALSAAAIPWSKSNTHSKYILVDAKLTSRGNVRTKAVTAGALNFSWRIGPYAGIPPNSTIAQVDIGFTVYDDDVHCAYKNNWWDLWVNAFETSSNVSTIWINVFARDCSY